VNTSPRYAHFRALGMFVGSGAVEAGCKAIIAQRLKPSDMRWSLPVTYIRVPPPPVKAFQGLSAEAG
jgi:hypothetical protein